MAYVPPPGAGLTFDFAATYTPPDGDDIGGNVLTEAYTPNKPSALIGIAAPTFDSQFSWSHVEAAGDVYRLQELLDNGTWSTVQDDIATKSLLRDWSERQFRAHRVFAKRNGVLSAASDIGMGKTNAEIKFDGPSPTFGPGVKDANDNAIEGARVAVIDVINGTILAVGLTDVNGDASFEVGTWPALAIAIADPMRDNVPVSQFAEDFPSISANWIKLAGSGSASVVADAGTSDNSALEANGYVLYEHNQNIALDDRALYRVYGRVSQVTDPSAGGKDIIIGIAGIHGDGTTRVNILGLDAYTSQHHFAADGQTLTAGAGYTEFEGYFWFGGTAAGGESSGRSDPKLLHNMVKSIRPLFALNQDGDGVARLDYIKIDIVARAGTADTGTSENPGKTQHHLVI